MDDLGVKVEGPNLSPWDNCPLQTPPLLVLTTKRRACGGVLKAHNATINRAQGPPGAAMLALPCKAWLFCKAWLSCKCWSPPQVYILNPNPKVVLFLGHRVLISQIWSVPLDKRLEGDCPHCHCTFTEEEPALEVTRCLQPGFSSLQHREQ